MNKDEQQYLYLLGIKIEKLYREKYPSQNAFAKAVGCDTRTIRRVIRGEQNVSLILLKRIAENLDMQIDEVLPRVEVV